MKAPDPTIVFRRPYDWSSERALDGELALVAEALARLLERPEAKDDAAILGNALYEMSKHIHTLQEVLKGEVQKLRDIVAILRPSEGGE
jgi:hypothetical protein